MHNIYRTALSSYILMENWASLLQILTYNILMNLEVKQSRNESNLIIFFYLFVVINSWCRTHASLFLQRKVFINMSRGFRAFFWNRVDNASIVEICFSLFEAISVKCLIYSMCMTILDVSVALWRNFGKPHGSKRGINRGEGTSIVNRFVWLL